MIICWYCHNKQYSAKPCPHHEEEEELTGVSKLLAISDALEEEE